DLALQPDRDAVDGLRVDVDREGRVSDLGPVWTAQIEGAGEASRRQIGFDQDGPDLRRERATDFVGRPDPDLGSRARFEAVRRRRRPPGFSSWPCRAPRLHTLRLRETRSWSASIRSAG